MPLSAQLSLPVRLLMSCSGKTPLVLKRALLLRICPKQAAHIIVDLAPDEFRDLTLTMPLSRVAKVAMHVNPHCVHSVYMSLPDAFHLRLTRELCLQRAYAKAAGFADFLSAMQLKVLFFALNDVAFVVQIIRHMENLRGAARSLRNCSTGYLCRLTEEAAAKQNVAAMARVLGLLSMQRQADVCANLTPATLMLLLPQLLPLNSHALSQHLPPQLITVLYGSC